MQPVGKLIRCRWTVRAGTRAMIAWLARLAAFLTRRPSNHSQSLRRVGTSLHIAIRNKVAEWGKWKWLRWMVLEVLVIFLRGILQILLLRCCRMSWPFRKCRKTWEYQFGLNFWQYHLFFVVRRATFRDRIRLHRLSYRGNGWKLLTI